MLKYTKEHTDNDWKIVDITDWFRKAQTHPEVLRLSPLEMSVSWNPAEVGYGVWAYVVYRNKEVAEVNLENHKDFHDPAALAYKFGAHQLDSKVHITTLTSELPERVVSIFICLKTIRRAAQPHSVELSRKGLLVGYDPVSFKLGPSAIDAHTVLAGLHHRPSGLDMSVINRYFPVTKPQVKVNGDNLHG